MIVSSALIMWRGIMLVCGNESPMVVVLSGSMEPSMYRGDILVLVRRPSFEIGDVVVYLIDNEKIPIVNRISSIQEVVLEKDGKRTTLFLSKGDNNPVDDRGLYPKGKMYLDESNIVGHVFATIPYSGYFTLLLNDYPMVKYALLACMFISVLVTKDPN